MTRGSTGAIRVMRPDPSELLFETWEGKPSVKLAPSLWLQFPTERARQEWVAALASGYVKLLATNKKKGR